MADDDARRDVGPEELFAPPGPRRSSYTPPSNDRESLEAAASVFNDDAIAAAMAAELARVASGSIPIIRPVAPGLPLAGEPGMPATAPEPEITANYQDAQLEPEFVEPVVAEGTDSAERAASSATEPSIPIVPLTPFEVPTAIVQQPRLAPASTDSGAFPPPYLGAPAPTVPPADVPPPPGYTSAPSPVSPTPAPEFVSEPAPVVDAPLSPEHPPQRRSLDNEELIRALRGEGDAAGGTLDAIEQLQAELRLRDREAKAYVAWESSMTALGTPEALSAVAGVRPEFSDLLGSVPAPTTQASPVVPPQSTPVESAPSASPDEPSLDEPSLEGTAFASPTPQTVAPAQDAEPGVDGGSDDQLLQFPGAATLPEESARETTRHSRFEPPLPVEPPALIEPPPVNPRLASPETFEALPRFESDKIPASATESPTEQSSSTGQLPPSAPSSPAPFESLLAGERDAQSPPGATWPSVAPDSAQPPASNSDAETERPLPFGSGAAGDNPGGPETPALDGSLGTVSVNTSGIAVVGLLPPTTAPVVSPAERRVATAVPRRRVFVPEAAGEEPTPIEHRVGRAARLFWLWFASNSSIVAVVLGGIVFSLGISLRQAVVATLAGVALSFIPLGLGTLAGKRSGQPTMVISRATFGVVGNILPAIVALVTRVFWAAALLWLVGAGSSSILTGANATDGFSARQLTFILMLFGFVLVAVCTYYGYRLLAIVQLVVSVGSAVFLVGFIVLTWHEVDLTAALRTGDGSWMLAVSGAVLVFSFVGLAWANSSSDLARYQRPGSSGAGSMLWATFGTALPSFLLIAYGSLLAASSTKIAAGLTADPFVELGRLLPGWYPGPLLIATALSLLSGATLTMYSGGFALQSIGLQAPRRVATLVVALFVLILAIILGANVTNFDQMLRNFATTLAVPIAAWAGIFGAETMIRNRRFESRSLLRRGGVYADVRWPNLVALVIIVAIGLGLTTGTVAWLGWEGYLFDAFGVAAGSPVAASDIGVIVALVLGLVFPIVAGVPAIRRQEAGTRPAE